MADKNIIERMNRLSELISHNRDEVGKAKGEIKALTKTIDILGKKQDETIEISKNVNNLQIIMERLSGKIETLSTTMLERLNNSDKNISEHEQRLQTIEKRPGETAIKTMWHMVTPILSAIGSLIAGYFLFGGNN